VLRRYGFGDRFLNWLAILLSSASTKVLLNGAPGPPIWHQGVKDDGLRLLGVFIVW
jgi:hypothetical protein